jgi:hypothetical protein
LLCGGVVLWTRVKVVQLATRRIRPGEGARAIKLQGDHKRLPPGGEVTGHVEVTRTGRVRRLEVSVLPRPHPELRWNHVETHDWAAGHRRAVRSDGVAVRPPTTARRHARYADDDGFQISWAVHAHCESIRDVDDTERIEVASAERCAGERARLRRAPAACSNGAPCGRTPKCEARRSG